MRLFQRGKKDRKMACSQTTFYKASFGKIEYMFWEYIAEKYQLDDEEAAGFAAVLGKILDRDIRLPDKELTERCFMMSKPRCPKHSDVEQATHLVRNSGLGAIAAKCLRLALAAARNKHREPWQLWHGYYAVREELNAWLAAEEVGDKENAKREFGNILHAVLSLGAHMGYDIEAALCDAIWRNADRARKEGSRCDS